MNELSLLERLLIGYGTVVPNHPRKWWLHPQLRKWLGVRVDREVEVVRGGLRWSLNPADCPQESLFWLGTQDNWDLAHLRRHVVPGGVVLDVGANYGRYSLNLATALNRVGQIHALEPDPDNFERLRRHIDWNGLADVIQARCLGVSDHPETVAMTRQRGNTGHTAVASQGELKGISLTTVDAYCERAGLDRLDVIVLDVEGYEERALRGAEQTLTRLKPIVMVELFCPVMEVQGSSPEAVARILSDHGYDLFFARKGRLEPLTTLPAGDLGRNAFAFHRDKVPASVREAGRSGSIVTVPRLKARAGAMLGAARTSLRRYRGGANYRKWGNPQSLSPDWDSRTEQIARLIPPGKSVLEFGAGRMVLKNCLPEGCKYTPSDLVDRGGGTIVCDLNARELPPFPTHDVAVFSGVLEYINDVNCLIGHISKYANIIIFSYVDSDKVASALVRRSQGWVNDYQSSQFEEVFARSGFWCDRVEDWGNQKIYRFVRGQAGGTRSTGSEGS